MQCRRYYSTARKSPCYRQKKRHLNPLIEKFLCSTMSQRRIAKLLGISRLTLTRKFLFLGKGAISKNAKDLEAFEGGKIKEVLVDEMEDIVHTKCKPVSIALIVTHDRRILGHAVSRIRPKTRKLNEKSKKKYPQWTPNAEEKFGELLKKLKPILHDEVIIHSDKKWFYERQIREILPNARHVRYKSRRAKDSGQGELKEGHSDPLFPLNHTCGMLRANINRLIRKTWCTSKKLEALDMHIAIYTHFHNNVLLK